MEQSDRSWVMREPFLHLPWDKREELKKLSTPCAYPKGSILFEEGEKAQFLWVIEQGWVRLVKRATDGKAVTLDLVTPKDGLCGLSAFSADSYLASAVATTPVQAVRIPAQPIRQLLRRHGQFAACVAGIFSQRLHHMASAYSAAYAPVRQRITMNLLRLKEDFGTDLPVTRRELAELSGTTVETAIRITRAMQRDGILKMNRGHIALARPRTLKEDR